MIISSGTDQSTAATVIIVIAGVSAATAGLIYLLWRTVKSVERMERDPRYLRRRLFWFGMLYVAGAVFAVYEVAVGDEPLATLVGLPVSLAFAWFWLRAATRVRVPPRN